jgi:hypothetical protein
MRTFTCRSTFLYGCVTCVAGRGEITDQRVSVSDTLSRNWTLGAFAWTHKNEVMSTDDKR